MTKTESEHRALERARGGSSVANYPAIIEGFMQKGIAAEDIKPRVNVLTYGAWKAIGRQVIKGEKGVKVVTWIVMPERRDPNTGALKHKAGKRPRTTTVFHVSQTKEIDT